MKWCESLINVQKPIILDLWHCWLCVKNIKWGFQCTIHTHTQKTENKVACSFYTGMTLASESRLPVLVFFSLVDTLLWACTDDRLVTTFSSVFRRDWWKVKHLVPGAHSLAVSSTRLVQLHCRSVLCREMSKTQKKSNTLIFHTTDTNRFVSWQVT